jgi:hypothetical protein
VHSAAQSPRQQVEYQLVLKNDAFRDRTAGETRFLNDLQPLAGRCGLELIHGGPSEAFEYVFLDTPDGRLRKNGYALRVVRSLSSTHVTVALKHNGVTISDALSSAMTPHPDLQADARAKIENDLHGSGDSKWAHSVKLRGLAVLSRLPAGTQIDSVAALAAFFPHLAEHLHIEPNTPLARVKTEARQEYKELRLGLAGTPWATALEVRYATVQDLQSGTALPTKVEFSWKRKDGENSWAPEAAEASGQLFAALKQSEWLAVQ